MRGFWLPSAVAFAAAALLAQPVSAAPITVNFVSALIEITGPEPLPIELSGFPNNLRLRFHVPNAASILSINSLDISVEVYDDGDAQTNEEGDVVFVLQGIGQPNFVVQSFGPGLNAHTFASPLTVNGSVNPADFSNVLAEIQNDGFFLLRVNRNGGDFWVKSGTVTLDAQIVPEPKTFMGSAAAFLALLLIRRGRRFSGTRR
jgi:hypothetical protein